MSFSVLSPWEEATQEPVRTIETRRLNSVYRRGPPVEQVKEPKEVVPVRKLNKLKVSIWSLMEVRSLFQISHHPLGRIWASPGGWRDLIQILKLQLLLSWKLENKIFRKTSKFLDLQQSWMTRKEVEKVHIQKWAMLLLLPSRSRMSFLLHQQQRNTRSFRLWASKINVYSTIQDSHLLLEMLPVLLSIFHRQDRNLWTTVQAQARTRPTLSILHLKLTQIHLHRVVRIFWILQRPLLWELEWREIQGSESRLRRRLEVPVLPVEGRAWAEIDWFIQKSFRFILQDQERDVGQMLRFWDLFGRSSRSFSWFLPDLLFFARFFVLSGLTLLSSPFFWTALAFALDQVRCVVFFSSGLFTFPFLFIQFEVSCLDFWLLREPKSSERNDRLSKKTRANHVQSTLFDLVVELEDFWDFFEDDLDLDFVPSPRKCQLQAQHSA